MAIPTLLRSGIEIANQITKSYGLQSQVQYRRKTGNGASGPTFAAATPIDAVVDFKAVQVRGPDGTVTSTRAMLDLIDIAQVVTVTAGNGVTTDDVFILPDGTTGPTLGLGGFVDAGTGRPVATTVMLG